MFTGWYIYVLQKKKIPHNYTLNLTNKHETKSTKRPTLENKNKISRSQNSTEGKTTNSRNQLSLARGGSSSLVVREEWALR